MLIDVRLDQAPVDTALQAVLAILGDSTPPIRIAKGVYETNHFNFDHELGIRSFDDRYPHLKTIEAQPDDGEWDNYFGAYGVCDDYTQVLARCRELADDWPEKYVMSVTRIRRDEESEDGGWRWHKWGEYIGTQQPTTEYIFDEPSIEQVYCYHIYKAPRNLIVE